MDRAVDKEGYKEVDKAGGCEGGCEGSREIGTTVRRAAGREGGREVDNVKGVAMRTGTHKAVGIAVDIKAVTKRRCRKLTMARLAPP
jgi:hypothetical protein